MDALFASGRIIDAVLLLVVVEASILAWIGRRRGLPLASLLANLASGAALMLALRAALVGAGWIAVAGWMLAGLVAHLADLSLRFRRPRHNAAARPWPEQRRKRPRSRASPD